MKVKEYICVIEEIDGKMLRIKGQFLVKPKLKIKKNFKNIIQGRALNSAEAGDIVMVKI